MTPPSVTPAPATPTAPSLRHDFLNRLPSLCHPTAPRPPADPQPLLLNASLASDLGFTPDWFTTHGPAVFSGSVVLPASQPVAQAYAGHQFGHFAGLLGDGRAVLLGELVDTHGRLVDVALKGSGPTIFSRGGDGFAGAGPVLREYVISEAMHALGIPTTRSLAAVATGATIWREPGAIPGAVLCRIAQSHIRIGTFEFASAGRGPEVTGELMRYAAERHYPGQPQAHTDPVAFLHVVGERLMTLVSQWLSVGFVHGVMNTDNTTISGETLDFGPCAFLDHFDPATRFSSIDRDGRYRYEAQPDIAIWNLGVLARTLAPLLPADAADPFTTVLDELRAFGVAAVRSAFCRKVGIADAAPADDALVAGLLAVLADHAMDFTGAFRQLSAALRADDVSLFSDTPQAREWFRMWRNRLGHGDVHTWADQMDRVNPVHIPRNHLIESALQQATTGNLNEVTELLQAVTQPFDTAGVDPRYRHPAPADQAPYVTYCGT